MPYDYEQAARQAGEQRRLERESAAREASAKKSPLRSSGAGGFVSNAPGSGSDKAADPPGKYDGGLSGGVIHTPEQEAGIRQKAATGGVITNADVDPRGYLGHFGRDDVLSKGHNVGHKKLGTAPLVKAVAPKGYRKLPGSASPQQGHAQYGTMSEAALGLRPNRAQRQQDAKVKASLSRETKKMMLQDPFPLRDTGAHPGAVNSGGGKMPPTTSNKKLSIKHETDRIAFNMRHARDHTADAKAARQRLAKIRKSKPPRG
jgi:hypothetical protein